MAGEDGIPTEAMVDYYGRRAIHEVGLIIGEGAAIDSAHAFDTLTVPRFETEEQIEGWKEIVEVVHRAGGAFAPQLWHTGPRAVDPIGPSPWRAPPRRDGIERPVTRPMQEEDFSQVLAAFCRTAAAAVAIGCDALEIHGAHGYLLDSFLSPALNHRQDAYGGSFENRMRFPLEVVRAVRGSVGADFPILYRFSQWESEDESERKFRAPEELAVWVRALREAGVDILHVSTRDATSPGFADRGLKTLATWTRGLSGLPAIAVGRVSLTLGTDEAYGEEPDVVVDPRPAIDLVESGDVDLLAVGRALIANPDWVPLVRAGDWQKLKPFHKSLLETLV
jgi:2,4-dienoyl-CoA reductase-like NADH-dependent reductase (Old Yellow Enzyme family)